MHIKKKNDDAEPSPDAELEQKVDAMMDLKIDESKISKDTKKPKVGNVEAVVPLEESTPPDIDIFKDAKITDTKTAPVLSKKSSKHKKIEPLTLKSPEEAEEPEPTEAEETESEPAEIEIVPDEPPEEAEDETPEEDEAGPEITEDEVVADDPVPDIELPDDEALEDPKTDEVIDDIVKEDADKVLDIEDEEKAVETPAHKPEKKQDTRSFKSKLGGFFKAWWRNKWARNATIIALLLALIGLAAWPSSRYMALNIAGVHSSASLKITDDSTGLPLKNVVVQLGSSEVKTSDDGTAKFSFVKLGKQKLVVDRVAFAVVSKDIVIGWGSNPLGEMSLEATGAQYTFDVKDYLSSKGVAKAEAVSGEASAFADKSGKIILTVEDPKDDSLSVKIQAEGYRTEDLTFAATTKDVFSLHMVPDQPVVYMSKKSGKYDLYKVDVDGKNKTLLLAGTGRERQSIGISVSPDGKQAALISSRGTKRDATGYLLDTLTLINLKDSKAITLDEAQSIRAIDWVGKRLIYTVTYGAPSAATGDRQRIVSYNTEESARAVLANSDYFNAVISSKGFVYYAIANSDPKQAAAFVRIKADGSGKQTVLNKQVWSIQQTDITKLSLETPDGWYDYTIGASTAQKGNPPAENYTGRQYIADASGTKHVWVESRDGKGVLLVHEESAAKDSMLVSASGVTMPARWLSDNAVVYRVSNSNETADYVKSLDGGEAKKISDVTPTFGPNANY